MLPDGWDRTTVGDICDVFTGGTPKRSVADYWNGDIPWMSSGEINQGVVRRVAEFITPLGMAHSNARLLPPGTVMMALNGQGKTRGKVAILEIETTCNQSLAGLVADGKRLLPAYLLYSLDAQYQAIRNITGDDARNGLNLGILRGLSIDLPPLDEQRRIAEVLRSVDDAIAATQAAYEATVSTQAAVFETFLQSGNRNSGSLPITGWTTGKINGVNQLPAEWRVVRLVDVARLESGHTPDRKKPEYWDGGDVEWISLHDTQNLERCDISRTEMRITKAGLANSSARLLPAGTVCFSRTATVGKCVIMAKSMATSQDFANFVCSPELNNRYLLHLMRWMQPVWKALASGSTHKTIYMPTFKALQIILPSRAEQDEIAATNKDKIDQLKADVKTLAERDYEGRLIFWKQIVLLAPKNKSYAEEARKAAAQVAQHTYENPADGASVEAIRPRKEGFGNVLVVDLTIRNDSLSNLKDFIIACESRANSGTTIDVNRRPIYDVVNARSSRSFREINMGLINNQVSSTDCRVEGASIG